MDNPSASAATLPEKPPDEAQEKRLWIGNLDTRVTEYQLIKLVQRFGKIEKFDLLFHRSGPMEGQPRGYAFVSYETLSDAIRAKEKLHAIKLGSKHIAVKWAHAISADDLEKPKQVPELSVLAGAKKSTTKASNKIDTIQAIEEKLRAMESSAGTEPDFTGRTVADLPAVWKPTPQPMKHTRPGPRERHRDRKKGWPYSKLKLR